MIYEHGDDISLHPALLSLSSGHVCENALCFFWTTARHSAPYFDTQLRADILNCSMSSWTLDFLSGRCQVFKTFSTSTGSGRYWQILTVHSYSLYGHMKTTQTLHINPVVNSAFSYPGLYTHSSETLNKALHVILHWLKIADTKCARWYQTS